MRPKDLLSTLATTIQHKLPVLIKGAPGIGKTDIVNQAAQKAEANLIVMHPVVSDPTDFKGLPVAMNGKADFLPYGDLRALCEAKVATVAFLDDLGQAPAAVQAAAMQLILARKINDHAVSDEVTFMAATNRKEDRAGVTGILEPVKSRFATILELEANIDDWCTWALQNDVPVELVAFVRFRPDLFSKPEPVTTDITNRVSPRTLNNLGRLFNVGIRHEETFAGACGKGFAAEFMGFLDVFASLPDIDTILLNPKKAPVPEQPSAKFAVATALAARMERDTFGRIVSYMERMEEEYMILCVRDGTGRAGENSTLAQSKDFIAWAAKNYELISG